MNRHPTMRHPLVILVCIGGLILSCATNEEKQVPITSIDSTQAASLEEYKTERSQYFPTYTQFAKLTQFSVSTSVAEKSLPTLTPVPSITPPPPPDEFLLPVSSSSPAKQVVIVYSQSEGDAGGDHFLDLASFRHEPIVVIYTDGQALINQGNYFIEEWLSEAQLCSLYSKLKQAMQTSRLADRYNENPTPEYCISGCGEPGYTIQISGNDGAARQYLSVLEAPYLSRESLLPFEIIHDFATAQQGQRFISDRILIWFENVRRTAQSPEFDGFSLYWPEDPYQPGVALEPFIGDYSAGLVVITGSEALDLQDRFNNLPTVALHRESEQDYVLILRPLLPHELPDHFLRDFLFVPDPALPSEIALSCVQ